MTKEEAIYILRNTAWLAPSGTLESVEEAVYMAIEALERMDTHQCVNPTHEPSRAHELKERRHKSCPMQEVHCRPMRGEDE